MNDMDTQITREENDLYWEVFFEELKQHGEPMYNENDFEEFTEP